MFLSEEAGVRKQDGYKIIVSNTMAGRLVGWERVRSHQDQLTEYDDPAVSVYIGRIISAVAEFKCLKSDCVS